VCSKCNFEVIVGPLVGQRRLLDLKPGTGDIEDFASSAMQFCSVPLGKRKIMKEIILKAFEFALQKKE
jgi:hypothetical protein